MEIIRRSARALVRPLIAALVLAALALTGLLDGLDAMVADRLVQRLGHREPSRQVAVIGVTDDCLRELGSWPWSRAVHARRVKRLAAAGAKTVLWDMVLADKGADAAGDEALARALAAARNVMLPIAAARSQSAMAIEGPGYVEVQDAFTSLAPLNAAAAGLGHTFLQADSDGVVRRLVPELRVNGHAYPALSLVGAVRAGGPPAPPPVDGSGRLRLNYYGPTGVPFEVLPYHAALDAAAIPDEAFRGRVVVVGGASQALHDMHTTPVGQLFGLEVLATAASNLLDGSLLRTPSAPVLVLLVLVAGAISGLAALALGRKAGAVALLALGALGAWRALALLNGHLLLPYVAMAGASVAAWILVAEAQLEVYQSREDDERARLASAAATLEGVELSYRAQAAPDGLAALARLAAGPPLPDELATRARALKLRGLLLRREERELETFLEREDLAKIPVTELVGAATDLERRGRDDLAERVLVALQAIGPNKAVALPLAETLARVRATIKKGAQDSPLLPIARRAVGEAYQKVTLVGVGGMGFVVRALRLSDERWVAVKFLSPAYAHRMDFRKRFEREATILSRLQHPAVVEFLGSSDGEPPYYVMEYFSSTGLSEVLAARRTLPLAEAAHMLAPVARALELAHRHDVVHRDVKPANILVGLDGRVKLTDFGIAKAGDLSVVTATGDSLGTPDYMSPEQLLAGASQAGPASDVYSFALVLYEALVGDLPFGRGAPAFASASRAVPPPTQRGVPLAPWFEAILMRALATKVADRTVTIAELAAALESL